MQDNYRSGYLVTKNNEQSNVKFYRYPTNKIAEIFLVLKPCKFFIGKSLNCRVTEISGACDEKMIMDICRPSLQFARPSFFSGFEITKLSTEDKLIDFISLMGNNMIPTAIAVGQKYTYSISDCYRFNVNNNTEEEIFLNSTNYSLYLLDFLLAEGGEGAFKTMEFKQNQLLTE